MAWRGMAWHVNMFQATGRGFHVNGEKKGTVAKPSGGMSDLPTRRHNKDVLSNIESNSLVFILSQNVTFVRSSTSRVRLQKGSLLITSNGFAACLTLYLIRALAHHPPIRSQNSLLRAQKELNS